MKTSSNQAPMSADDGAQMRPEKCPRARARFSLHRPHGIGLRLFSYFTAFALMIMVLLWVLQILFLQVFYQQMKIRELYNVADSIESLYDTDPSSLFATIVSMTGRTDVYVQIENDDMVLFSSTMDDPSDKMGIFGRNYHTDALKDELLNGGASSVVSKQNGSRDGNGQVMVYASLLGTTETSGNIFLFIYTPLSAVGTTIDILAMMLVIVTALSVFAGIIASIVMSRRLARPIKNITCSAAELAKGNYSVVFNGTGYTETEDLANTLNYAADELSKADKLQKDLIANVSHDLKTPLTMVKSYAEMIRDLSGDNPEKRGKHLQVIISEADRLNELVNDLTALSKMQAKVDTADLAEVDLATLVRTNTESFSLHTEQEGFSFTVTAEGDTSVEADERKLNQVFANLIGNAIRYSSDDKRIDITVRELPESDAVRCEVADHGQGIAEDEIDSVWDRYYRSSKNLSRDSKGTGLGLAIVKQIFILHNAKYGVESTLGEGSTFWFEIPKKHS